MEPERITRLTYEDFKEFTDNFSEENYIGKFQFGKLYRGRIEWSSGTQHLTLKIWEPPEMYYYEPGDNEERLMDEVVLLRHEKIINHPGMVKLYGYCLEGDHLGVAYDFKPLDTVYNLALKDDFTWQQRIKVAIGFARLLKFLHTGTSLFKPFMIRNLDAAHIMLDEDYNPKLIDFSMITGGILPDKTIYIHYVKGCYGYRDPLGPLIGGWEDKSDVFAFGTILLSLIAKRVYTREDLEAGSPWVDEWAYNEYYEFNESDWSIKKSKRSLAHGSLEAEPGFLPADGINITKLAMQCIKSRREYRPNMKEVVKHLLKLQVVKQHAGFLGIDQVPNGHDSK